MQTFTLSNTDVFEIVDGAVIIKDSSAIDFEKNSTIDLVVQINTKAGLKTATIHLVIGNVNDNKPVFSATNVASELTSLQQNGATLTLATANDADGDKLTYRIIDVVANKAATKALKSTEGIFEIDAATGSIRIADISLIAFATIASYIVSVEVSDGVHTDTFIHTVTLMNMNTEKQSVSGIELVIYPTVTSNSIHVETPVSGTLSITALGGTESVVNVSFDHSAVIDASGLPTGAYFIKISTDNSVLEGIFFRQ